MNSEVPTPAPLKLWRNKWLRGALLTTTAIAGSIVACQMTSDPGPPTVAEYAAKNPLRTVAPADFTIAGQTTVCAKVPVVLDPTLMDVGAAYPGFIILNPRVMSHLPKVVALYAFGHECGHQLHGVSEEEADCYAVVRGEAQGWLDEAGVQQICDFWKPQARVDNKHLPGPERCELMKRCFAMAKKAR